jgi:hypothetical protein
MDWFVSLNPPRHQQTIRENPYGSTCTERSYVIQYEPLDVELQASKPLDQTPTPYWGAFQPQTEMVPPGSVLTAFLFSAPDSDVMRYVGGGILNTLLHEQARAGTVGEP